MKVLSLCDGISCGQVALERAGIPIEIYYASEIKQIAIYVTQTHYPKTIQLGDLTKYDFSQIKDIDLFLCGSPCQDLSIAHPERKGLKGEKSSLFYKCVEIMNIVKPKYFLFENVAMTPENYEEFSNILGIYPININSSRLSAQTRNRFYWTNIGPKNYNLFGFPTCAIPQPEDRRIYLKDIITSGYVEKEKARGLNRKSSFNNYEKRRKYLMHRYNTTGMITLVFEDINDKENTCRMFNKIELEKLQTLPKGYSLDLDLTQSADVIGDGWTVDVISYIFSFLKEK